ncbi:PAS domain S-box protein [Salidesulfovibrio brasiliensis]|uniref:PAS domain S-box protein n=1 Tax=Salidesulfovibrio brasiliensis TaxID=221711 RepID=UPI0006D1D82A|nr:PAS domain S-box protein [Salidesulfovibrio brasiliensis]
MSSRQPWFAASCVLAASSAVLCFALPGHAAGGLTAIGAAAAAGFGLLKRQDDAGVASVAVSDPLATVAANVPGMVLRCQPDEERTLRYMGSQIEALTGFSQERFMDRGAYLPFIYPDDRASVAAAVRKAVEAEDAYEIEYRMIHKDGSLRWLQERGQVVREGDTVLVDALVVDIMSRKEAEREHEDLRWHREAMESLEHALGCGGSLEDAAGRALEVVRQALGSDRAWLMRATSEDLQSWEIPAERTAMDYPGLASVGGEYSIADSDKYFLDVVLRNEEPTAAELGGKVSVPAMLAASFSVRSMLAMSIRTDDGTHWLFGLHQCSCDRVWTEREKALFRAMGDRLHRALEQGLARRDLLESQERFRIYTDQALLGICVLRNGRFEYVNRAMAKIFGYTRAELLAFAPDDVLSIIHPDDRLMVAEQMERKQEGKPDVRENYVFRGLRKDGSTCWVEIFSRTVHHGGEPADLAMMLDVTEKRRLQEQELQANLKMAEDLKDRSHALAGKTRELDEARTRLLQLDQMKSSMLTTVSHDLRTPLTSIIGFSKLLRKDVEAVLSAGDSCDQSSAAARRLERKLGIVEEEGEHLTKLVNDFLDLTQLESGEMQWRDEDVDLGKALEGAVAAGERLFSENEDVAFEWDMPAALPTMRLDPVRLEQAVLNLVNNAARFTENGTVSLLVNVEDAQVRIEINDTGRGIPEDELDRIFESFHRVEQGDTLRRTRRGSGLGLTIAREIVDHYGGSIEVVSALGRGSTFTILLPLNG